MVGWTGGQMMAMRSRRLLSEGAFTGLYFIYKYRFQTIAQFAKTANFSPYHAAEVLRGLERWGMVGYFGFIGIPGQGKTPKVYYLKRKGFDLLCAEVDIDENVSGAFREVHKETTWTPQMYHRLKIIDLLLTVEQGIQNRPQLQLIKTFAEYNMVKKG